MAFYNTTLEDYPIATKQRKKNNVQEDVILYFFEHNEGEYTPFDIWEFCDLDEKKVPITSVRRAINDLTKKGKLIKTGNKKMGNYGMMNYCWTFNTNQ